MSVEDLVSPCIVRLQVGKDRNGTGFFVAPGLILTCHHVVSPLKTDETVRVAGPGGAWEAVADVEDIAPQDDLALLSVPRPDSPIAMLGAAANIGDTVWLQGYVETDTVVRLEPQGGRLDGTSRECLKAGGPELPLLRFSQARVLPGMSGAPLVNLCSAAVCGVVTRTLDRNSDAGGRAVPLRAILGAFPQLESLQTRARDRLADWWTYGLQVPDGPMPRKERVRFLRMFPLGPAISGAMVPPELDGVYERLDVSLSLDVMRRLNAMRVEAGAEAPEDVSAITIDAGDPAYGVRAYWKRAMPQVWARGPRMMAALIAAAPAGAFIGLKEEVLELLARLRTWPASRGGA